MRGGKPFDEKAAAAAAAGARGVVFLNNDEDQPDCVLEEMEAGEAGPVEIPVVMLSRNEGKRLMVATSPLAV